MLPVDFLTSSYGANPKIADSLGNFKNSCSLNMILSDFSLWKSKLLLFLKCNFYVNITSISCQRENP